jgi:hypothetical protein
LPYKNGKTQMKAGFLLAVARLFSDHYDFWTDRNRTLTVTPAQRAKLKAFLLDSDVVRLAEGGSQSRTMLRLNMIEAVNHRARTKLRPRQVITPTEREINIAGQAAA